LPDLEDAETAITEQERWGLGLTRHRTEAARRSGPADPDARCVHEQRLNAIEARLDRIDPPAAPTPPP
jgi:hypothetical protein